jgi:hypothetical protein
MFLTKDELTELTDSARKDRQVQRLQQNGVRFVISLAGRPKILNAEFERIMLGGAKPLRHAEPDFSKING